MSSVDKKGNTVLLFQLGGTQFSTFWPDSLAILRERGKLTMRLVDLLAVRKGMARNDLVDNYVMLRECPAHGMRCSTMALVHAY